MSNSAIKGGEFLIRNTDAQEIFCPEDWNEEQLMILEMCRDFIEKEVRPKLERIDEMEEGLMPALLEKAGQLGLLAVSIPEEYGGLGKDFVSSMLVTEGLGAGHSFAVAQAAHSGIGTLPILYYGNEEQKAKYIPRLATGEWKGAYCLTEPNAGSDANSGKSRATLSADGSHYILNGQKMWITNGGFADVLTVFAKIDDDENLSAFIVEAQSEGISLNPEEKKMGIKGSSTRQIFFNDVKVPVENLLSTRGNGFKIAVNILNLGRVKLGGAALGAAKKVIDNSIEYALSREQFGRVIAKYGAIKHKIAEQAIRTFVTESAIYRASKNIEDATQSLIAEGMEEQRAKLKATEQFAIEAAIIKVHASEALDYVVDEGVQIYGGMGYSAEAPMDRAYRDSRINRIFEGTNEINRLLAFDMMIKKAMKQELPLLEAAQSVASSLMELPDFSTNEDHRLLAAEEKTIMGMKKAVLMIAGASVQKFMMGMAKEQELIMLISDMLIETYACESALLRVQKNERTEDPIQKLKSTIVQVYVYDAAARVHQQGRAAINYFADGDEARMMLLGLRRFTKTEDTDTISLRREIAAYLLEQGRYAF